MNNKRIILVVLVVALALGLIGYTNAGQIDKSSYTMEEYNRIKTGMSYEKVVGILGAGGKVISRAKTDVYRTTVYSWQNQNGSNLTVKFRNGKVISKDQDGLY
mgnify:CR=1 FL=1